MKDGDSRRRVGVGVDRDIGDNNPGQYERDDVPAASTLEHHQRKKCSGERDAWHAETGKEVHYEPRDTRRSQGSRTRSHEYASATDRFPRAPSSAD